MLLLDGGHPLVKCKHCHQPVQARHAHHHLNECPQYKRRKKLGRMAFEKGGKRLYAIAIQRRVGINWLPEMHYTHAANAREARTNFLFSERDRTGVHIVDIGLSIGMFAVDRDGKILVAD